LGTGAIFCQEPHGLVLDLEKKKHVSVDVTHNYIKLCVYACLFTRACVCDWCIGIDCGKSDALIVKWKEDISQELFGSVNHENKIQ